MRKIFLLFFLLSCFFTLSVHPDNVKRMKMLAPIKVRSAVITDSVNTAGERPELAKILMRTHIPVDDSFAAATVINADSTGCFVTERIPGNNLYLFMTDISADRFAKATLKFTSPSYFEVYVDGKKQIEKNKIQDSFPVAESREYVLRMEPFELHKIAVKMVVTEKDSCSAMLSVSIDTKGDTITKITTTPDQKKRYLLENTIYGNRVQSVNISPDGKFLLTTYLDYYDRDRHNTYTELTEVKTGKKIATFPAGYKALAWTPRSSQLYYKATSDVGEKIILVNPATLQETVIADHVPAGAFRWAPDEKSLFFSITEQIAGDNKPVHRLLDRSDRVPGNRSRSFIWRYDLSTGINERLTWGLRSTSLCDISSDATKLLYICSEADDDKWPFRKSSLYSLDIASLNIDTLVVDDYFMASAYFSPDASQVIITGGPESLGGIGKNCGEHPIANNYDTQAFVLTIADKSVEPITKDFNPTVSFLQWNSYDKCIYFKANDCDREPVYSYNPKTKKFSKLPLEGDCVRSFSLSRHSSSAAYISVTASSSQAAWLFDVRKSKNSIIADPYAKVLDNIEMGTIHDWTFTASDGTEIDAFYCLPPSFNPEKKYPLIVYYYGGTTPTLQSMDNPYAPQLFSSRGYVSLVINPSGTIGYGQEFSARHVNAWGKRTADDIIEGTKTFCKEFAYVDSSRIGCLGASYGGFMTQYLQTQTDIFAAAASHAGISNITSYWGEGYWGVGYNAVAAAQSYPWNNPDLFTRQGSLFNADKINTPLLLLHGTSDTNVPIGESIQLYNALRILGKTVEFVRVDGEDHFISDIPKRILWHNSIMAWFERWLKDDPRWWNDIYPERMIK